MKCPSHRLGSAPTKGTDFFRPLPWQGEGRGGVRMTPRIAQWKIEDNPFLDAPEIRLAQGMSIRSTDTTPSSAKAIITSDTNSPLDPSSKYRTKLS